MAEQQSGHQRDVAALLAEIDRLRRDLREAQANQGAVRSAPEQFSSKERLSPTMRQFLWEVQQKILDEANPLLRVELEREWREEGLWVEKPAG